MKRMQNGCSANLCYLLDIDSMDYKQIYSCEIGLSLRIDTACGTFLIIALSIHSADVLVTVVLAAIGAAVSFTISWRLMESSLFHKRQREVMKSKRIIYQ